MAEYTLYNKKYNYDDLARIADSGINEYISQLKRGNRDFESFKDAYIDMMQGIKDGSITYQDGKFVATTNTDKRRNSDKKYRDYYGLVANYIYNKMLGINEVPEKKPEEPKTFNTKILQQNLLKQIFGNNTNPNVIDFINQDQPVNGVRTRANRTKLLKKYVDNIINDADNIFKDVDEKTKSYQLGLLDEAKQALSDNNITDKDILSLSRVFNGIDFSQMLTNQVPENEQKVKAPIQEVKQEVKQTNPTLSYNDFISTKGYGDITRRQGVQIIKPGQNKYNDYDSIYRQLINSENIPNNDKFRVVTDQERHKIVRVKPNNFNGKYLYYYKDRGGNIYRVVSKSYEDLYSEYKNSVQSKRNGGIIKAQSGINTEDLYTYGDEDAEWDLGNLYNALYDKPLNERSQWTSSNYNNKNSGVYGAAEGYNYNKDSNNVKTNIENNEYYKKFGNSLFDSNGKLTKVGEEYTKQLNQLINDPSAKIYNDDGTLRNSWTVRVKTINGTQPRTFNDLREYLNAIRNDSVLGPAHNVFMRRGTRYYVTNDKGEKQYVKPSDLTRFTQGTPQEIVEGDTIWKDIELFLDDIPQTSAEKSQVEQGGDSSSIQTRNEVIKPSNLQNVLQEVIPNALQLGKYLSNLRANKKVENTLLNSLIPILKNPYEVYSPVHGDWRNMVYYRQKANDLRRQVSNMTTADQEKNVATYLAADKQGAEYENQGNQLYDKMWLETTNRALQNMENNTKVRNVVANENIQNMANYWANRGQIQAGRIQSDQASTNNLYDYLANYFNDRIDKRRQFVLANEQNRLLKEYSDKKSELQNQIMSLINSNGDITDNAKYLDLKKQLQSLDLQYKDNLNKAASRVYGFNI